MRGAAAAEAATGQHASKKFLIEMTEDEVAYVRGLLVEHRVYYVMLAGSSVCSEKNRKMHEMVEGLWQKLKLK